MNGKKQINWLFFNRTQVNSTQDIIDGIENISFRFKELLPPTIPILPSQEEETDSRIRIKVESVDFLQHEEFYAGTFDSLYVKNITIANIIGDTIELNGNWEFALNGRGTTSSVRLKIESSNSNNGIYKFFKTAIYNPITNTTKVKLDNNYLNNNNDFSGVVNFIYRQGQLFNYYNNHIEHKNDHSAIHIYFLRNISEYYTSGFGVAALNSNRLSMINPGTNEIHTNAPIEDGIGLLAHEISHALGLRHTFESSPFTPDFYTPDSPTGICNDSTISNNILGYNYCRSYLSPNQIAYMRQRITSTSNLMLRILETRQSTGHNVVITEPNTVWERHEIIGDSLIIEPGASLIVRCKVHFSPDARVIIKQGGKMIIDGGILTNEHGKYWHGVQVYGDFYQHQYPAHNPTYQGLLVLQNGGTIEFAHDGARNWKNNSWWERGGVIQSNGGIFRNNQINTSSLNKILHITMFYETQKC